MAVLFNTFDRMCHWPQDQLFTELAVHAAQARRWHSLDCIVEYSAEDMGPLKTACQSAVGVKPSASVLLGRGRRQDFQRLCVSA
eukprot:4762278-Pyramimonas_sp.AAC.1